MRRTVLLLIITALLLGGCATDDESAAADPQPVEVVHIPGTVPQKLTLTALAVQRLGIRTTDVTDAPGGPNWETVPVPALVYDPDGHPWVYTNPVYLTYVRAAVLVDHVDGDNVVLRVGPPLGTPVVSVGAQELLGAEYGVGEE
jgi:hypothetical protein